MRILLGVLATALLLPMSMVAAGGAPVASGHGQAPPTISLVDMANNGCQVTASPMTCSGGFTANETFRNSLSRGEAVTLTMAYIYADSVSVTLSFSDSLGNTPTVVSSQCSASAPIICTAVGYFLVTSPGDDNIFFTEQGGTVGAIWYNAEIWQSKFPKALSAVGASSFCGTSCTGDVSIGPVNVTATTAAIGVSAYAAVYPYTPATWTPSYLYYYSMTDCAGLGYQCQGGDSVLWQGTTTLAASYSFAATTSPVPVAWAGSAEAIYW